MAVAVPASAPAAFGQAAAALLAARPRPDVVLREVAAPSRVAPHAVALGAELVALGADEDDEPLASGRFVVLHDPAEQEGWEGPTRVVLFLRGEVEAEMARDPLLAEVVWSWVTEALAGHGAGAHAAGGTVTTTASRRFGVLRDSGDERCEVEVRCSWTPEQTGAEDAGLAQALLAHLGAFCDALGAVAGVPPVDPSVTALWPRALQHR